MISSTCSLNLATGWQRRMRRGGALNLLTRAEIKFGWIVESLSFPTIQTTFPGSVMCLLKWKLGLQGATWRWKEGSVGSVVLRRRSRRSRRLEQRKEGVCCLTHYSFVWNFYLSLSFLVFSMLCDFVRNKSFHLFVSHELIFPVAESPWQSCKIPQNMIKLSQIPALTEIPLNLWVDHVT